MRTLSRFGVVGAMVLSWAIGLPSASIALEKKGQNERAPAKSERARREQRQRRFRGMDTNRDGVITRSEWRGNEQSFERHDRNHDGVLAGDEIWEPGGERAEVPDWRERGDREEDALVRSFRQADRNSDGIISRSEWSSDADSFARVDANHDGVITQREFLGEGWEGAVVPGQEMGTSGGAAPADSRTYQSGFDRGLADGRQAGREDKQLRNQWDLEGQRELEQADAGYAAAMGPRPDYQAGYRAGFRAGYRHGFGPR